LTGIVTAWDDDTVKNISVAVDEDTYRRTRAPAAARQTLVSGLVREFLHSRATGENETERLKHEERALRDRIDRFDGTTRLTRDEVHAREA